MVVDQDGVALAERPTPCVLSAHPDRSALEHQRTERERLSEGPVDLALVENASPPLEVLRELRVRREFIRPGRDGAQDAVERLSGHAGFDRRKNAERVRTPLID